MPFELPENVILSVVRRQPNGVAGPRVCVRHRRPEWPSTTHDL